MLYARVCMPYALRFRFMERKVRVGEIFERKISEGIQQRPPDCACFESVIEEGSTNGVEILYLFVICI